mmetsp:Transcript_35243/g.108774  ORF Transcript_35243/g.108774 Transcript_35243/m.108774 type:complete len:212 (-) Transcript_35243:192-827(-)
MMIALASWYSVRMSNDWSEAPARRPIASSTSRDDGGFTLTCFKWLFVDSVSRVPPPTSVSAGQQPDVSHGEYSTNSSSSRGKRCGWKACRGMGRVRLSAVSSASRRGAATSRIRNDRSGDRVELESRPEAYPSVNAGTTSAASRRSASRSIETREAPHALASSAAYDDTNGSSGGPPAGRRPNVTLSVGSRSPTRSNERSSLSTPCGTTKP